MRKLWFLSVGSLILAAAILPLFAQEPQRGPQIASVAVTRADGTPVPVQVSRDKHGIEVISFALEAQQPPKEVRQGAPINKKTGKPFRTGAKKTPLHKILAALSSGKLGVHKAVKAPASVVRVPPKLSMLGNDQYGDCVTAESCAAIEAYSVGLGLDEIVITDQAAIDWATAHNVLNGAELLQVIQWMQSDGIKDSNGILRKAGDASTVDITNEAALQSAIATGPVSLGIDSTALPSGAGNMQGWYAFGGTPGQFGNEDHDPSVFGYGPAAAVFKALGVALPSGVDPNQTVYLIYTWATIGVVDFPWIQSTAGEAYVRNPTVTGLAPQPPQPPQPPNPPQPPTGQAVTIGYPAGSTVSDNGSGTVTITIPATSVPLPASVNITVTHNPDGSFTVSPQKKGK